MIKSVDQLETLKEKLDASEEDLGRYTDRELLMNNYQHSKDYGTLLPGIKREVH